MERSRPHRVSGTAGRRISGSPRSRRRPWGRGTQSSCATARRRSAARSPARSPSARLASRAARDGKERLARARYMEPRRRRTCTRHGSRSSSTRRSRRRCRGRRCMRCCAIDRAISCSTILVCARTRRGSSFAPTAPTFPTSCARISPSRWGCRSATRSARAAAAARRRSAPSGGTSRKRSRPRSRPSNKPQSRPAGGGLFGLFGEPPAAPAPKLPPRPQGLVPGFGYYLRTTIANAVHSGNGRTAADDDNTDYYPVPLKQETLRPGTIYADPYGHVLVLVEARGADGRRGGRLPRRRRAARRDGRAQALLARQFPVRAGPRRSAAPGSSASGRSSLRRRRACGG